MSVAPRSILLVCTGNICRSPLAEGILRHHAAAAGLNIEIDSAGTHAYHVGEAPDSRARQVAREHGITIDQLRARRIEAADFKRFERVLVADRANLQALSSRLGGVAAAAELLLAYAGEDRNGEVPDPYYGTEADFQACFVLLDRAVRKMLSSWANPA